MTKRRLGSFSVEPVGFGAMSLSHAYGRPPARDEAARVLHSALDIGYDFIDTAALYGFGANETLIGDTLSGRRNEFVLASKCGVSGVNGRRVVDGRPETLLATVEESLRRLRTDRIDLYYLHRRDFGVPIEDSVGALARMVDAGKVRAIGLSEVSAETIERAHAVHPVAAVQSEYSPWSREAEIAVLEKTRALGIAFVAFSPLARGFLAGGVRNLADLPERDIRRALPRFFPENFTLNLGVFMRFCTIAVPLEITPAQLSLAWGLARAPHIIPIPGTTRLAHLEENFAAGGVILPPDVVAAVEAVINRRTVHGDRYPENQLPEIDTERFEEVQ